MQEQIKNIGVVGAGAMGSGIAQIAASAGHKVFLYDTNENILSKALQSIQKSLNYLLEKGKIDELKKISILNNIILINKVEFNFFRDH